MANWASTDYVIEGPKEILKKIYDAIQHPDTSEGDNGWEGGVLKALGITWKERQSDGSGYYMRGFIQDPKSIEFNPETDKVLTFYAEEAWGATDFNEVLEKEFPDIKVYYNVIEEGEEIYATNDKEGKYFTDRFIVDTCIDGYYNSEYFVYESSIYKWLHEITDGKINCKEDMEKFNSSHEEAGDADENFISICEFEIVE